MSAFIQIQNIKTFLSQKFDLDNPNRSNALDGLRALAIVMVFNIHFFSLYIKNYYFCENKSSFYYFFGFLNTGHIGVDLFFVLSSYLMVKSIKKVPTSFFNFLTNRLVRLWPAYLAAALLFSSLHNLTFGEFWLNIFFVAPLLHGVNTFTGVTWSLAWEWIFYFILFFSIKNSVRFLSTTKIYVRVFIYSCIVTYTLQYFSKYINYPGMPRFIAFAVGVFIAEYDTQLKKYLAFLNNYAIVPFSIIMILLFQSGWIFYGERIASSFFLMGYYFYIAIFFAILVLVTTEKSSLSHKIFSAKPIVILGKISYSFYLIHDNVISLMSQKYVVNTIQSMLIGYVLTFVICVVFSVLMYLAFEANYKNWIKAKNRMTLFQ